MTAVKEICLRCGAEWNGARHLAVRQMPFQARLLRGRGGDCGSRLEELEAAGYESLGELLVALVWLVLGELPIPDDGAERARGGARCSCSQPAATRIASST